MSVPTTETTPGSKTATPSSGPLRQKIAWIWSFWRPHRGFLVFLFLFTLISSAVTVAYPMVLMVVLNRLAEAVKSAEGTSAGPVTLPSGPVRQVLLILAAIALGRLTAGFYPGFRAWMNNKIDLAVREAVFRRILRKDHNFFNRFTTGDLVTRLMDDISEYPKIAWFSCSGIFRAVDSGSRLLFCVGSMFFLDARLAAFSLLPLPVMMFLIYRLRSRLTDAGQAQQQAISRTNEMLERAFSGIRIVKAFCGEPGQTRSLDRILDHRVGVTYRLQRLWAGLTTVDTVASRLGQLVVLAVGGVMVVWGELTLGALYALYTYLDMLVQPMWDLPNLLVTSRQAFVCIDREEELIRFPEGRSYPAEGSSPAPTECLEFEGVGFGYDQARPVLHGIDLKVPRGETLAVIGPVASGKSTLLRLACGMLIPDQGVIRLNGKPLAEYASGEVRQRIGFTPQDSLLFSESIRENVVMGRESADPDRREEWVHRVLAAAQMEAEIRAMAEGVDTVLGQKGAKISGGQRQRVSIARALFHRPEILLLDDCTSSLDAENEDRLWDEIRSILPDATILLVSHRLATIRRAQRIAVLDRGRLTDLGSHEELRRRCEIYRKFLWRAEERERVMEGVPGKG